MAGNSMMNNTPEKMPSGLKKSVFFVVKLAVSCCLMMWVVIYQIDWSDFFTLMSETNIPLLFLAFGMRFLGFIFSSLRWQKLLQSQTVRIKFSSLFDSYIIASFFNLFMPTRIGGDIFRINDIRRVSKSISQSASSVFVERFLGIFILIVFAFFASLAQFSLAKENPTIWIGLTIFILVMTTLILSLYLKVVGRLIIFIPFDSVREILLSQWNTFRDNTLYLLSNRKALSFGIWYSFLLQVNVVVHYWIIGESLGFNLPLVQYFIIIPIQLMVLMLPSINGIGLREVSSIVLFGYYGIHATDAATFGFVDLAMMLAVGVIGCFRFIVRRTALRDAESLQNTIN